MKKFLFLTYGADDPTEDRRKKWMTWFATFQDKTVLGATPFVEGYEVSGAKTEKLTHESYMATGYMIIQAKDFSVAEEIAKRSPATVAIRVYEIMTTE